jgi:hypothetical protein
MRGAHPTRQGALVKRTTSDANYVTIKRMTPADDRRSRACFALNEFGSLAVKNRDNQGERGPQVAIGSPYTRIQ